MAKYGIYHNRKTKHPSIDVGERPSDQPNGKPKWLNYEMTHSPAAKNTYVEIDNPDGRDCDHPKTFIRKYLRKDRPRCKGRKMPFSLRPEQVSIIDAMLEEREENLNRLRQGKTKTPSQTKEDSVSPALSCESHRKGKPRLDQRRDDGSTGDFGIKPNKTGHVKRRKPRGNNGRGKRWKTR